MLFCISAKYTPKAMQAMGKDPKTNRQAAVEKLLTAAGAKLVGMYHRIADGPGAMVIFETEDGMAAASIVAAIATSDALRDIKMERLFSTSEVATVRKKRTELQKSYQPPA